MRTPSYTRQFTRDVKLAERRKKDLGKLRALLDLLIDGKSLPAVYLDHPLKGNWVGYRDAHLEPDWVLIYKITGEEVRFIRTGRHSDLFGE